MRHPHSGTRYGRYNESIKRFSSAFRDSGKNNDIVAEPGGIWYSLLVLWILPESRSSAVFTLNSSVNASCAFEMFYRTTWLSQNDQLGLPGCFKTARQCIHVKYYVYFSSSKSVWFYGLETNGEYLEISSNIPLIELCQQADEPLLSGILRNRNHVLHCLLPPVQQTSYTLRPRAHDRSRLPDDVNPLLR